MVQGDGAESLKRWHAELAGIDVKDPDIAARSARRTEANQQMACTSARLAARESAVNGTKRRGKRIPRVSRRRGGETCDKNDRGFSGISRTLMRKYRKSISGVGRNGRSGLLIIDAT